MSNLQSKKRLQWSALKIINERVRRNGVANGDRVIKSYNLACIVNSVMKFLNLEHLKRDLQLNSISVKILQFDIINNKSNCQKILSYHL